MKLKLLSPFVLVFGFFTFHSANPASAQNDTIRVMAYNTLGFGNGCQGLDNMPFYGWLDTIVRFANPDVVGLDKMECVKTSVLDIYGKVPTAFLDSIIYYSLDAAYPGRFAWCPFTDLSKCHEGYSSALFYNQNKLGYLSTTPMTWEQEDIDMFKFYYKQAWFSGSGDSTFLYVIVGHTLDASVTDTGENESDSAVMNKVRALFTHTPNLIFMGDFNTHESTNAGYEYITQTSDTNYIMDDPPFVPDGHLTYPDIWHSGNSAQAYFTTTTRVTTLPNSCGTTGGAKDWYDHITLSPWIVNNNNNISYVRNSYKTIGNNGDRAGISVDSGANFSAPISVLRSLFYFSDKYPVEVTLTVNPTLGVANIQSDPGSIKVNNPIQNSLVMHFATFLIGQKANIQLYDVCGRTILNEVISIDNAEIDKNINLAPGVYLLRFNIGGYNSTIKIVKE